eukprot:355821-Chlamydomonas_euryale.AAC.8
MKLHVRKSRFTGRSVPGCAVRMCIAGRCRGVNSNSSCARRLPDREERLKREQDRDSSLARRTHEPTHSHAVRAVLKGIEKVWAARANARPPAPSFREKPPSSLCAALRCPLVLQQASAGCQLETPPECQLTRSDARPGVEARQHRRSSIAVVAEGIAPCLPARGAAARTRRRRLRAPEAAGRAAAPPSARLPPDGAHGHAQPGGAMERRR